MERSVPEPGQQVSCAQQEGLTGAAGGEGVEEVVWEPDSGRWEGRLVVHSFCSLPEAPGLIRDDDETKREQPQTLPAASEEHSLMQRLKFRYPRQVGQ